MLTFPFPFLSSSTSQAFVWLSWTLTLAPAGGFVPWPSPLLFYLFFFNIYLFGCTSSQLQHVGSSVFTTACDMEFPDQGWNPGPLQWELRVLATGPPGKSPE